MLHSAARYSLRAVGALAVAAAMAALWEAVPSLADVARLLSGPWPAPEFTGLGVLVLAGIFLFYGGLLTVVALLLLGVAGVCLRPSGGWRHWWARRRVV